MGEQQGGARSTAVWTAGSAALLVVVLLPPRAALDALARGWGAGAVADPSVLVGPTAALLAWAAAVWLLLVLGLAHGARLPGTTGRLLGRAAARLAPASARRLLEVAVGVSLVVGAAGPAAADGSASPGPSALLDGSVPVVTGSPGVPDPPAVVLDDPAVVLDHPWTATTPAPRPTPDREPVNRLPATDEPTGPVAPTSVLAAATAPPTSPQQVSAPSPPHAPATASTRTAPTPSVVVRPGDSLWSIARDALAAQQAGPVTDVRVAQAWPAWWAANRAVVGEDPDLLLPGTRLLPPAR